MEFIKEKNEEEKNIGVGDLVENIYGECRIIIINHENKYSAIDLDGFCPTNCCSTISELVKGCSYSLLAKAEDLELRIKSK